jgi:flagellar basal-body rod protein FlgB
VELQPTDREVLLRLMSAAALRQDVLAGNIANQNTPGYRRRDVRFEELLVRELDRSMPRIEHLQPEIVVDDQTPASPDGNNVSMEVEQSLMRENQLLFELFAALLQGRGDLKRSAIGGR